MPLKIAFASAAVSNFLILNFADGFPETGNVEVLQENLVARIDAIKMVGAHFADRSWAP